MTERDFVLQGAAGEKLSSMAYNSLREMIVYGQLRPGERLYPNDLAQRFGISATPVKEAITRLATEGYLVAIPRRGYNVTVPTPKRIRELWQVRLGLEVTAGELLIAGLKRGDLGAAVIADLEHHLYRLEAEGSDEHRAHIELNAAFHQKLVELAGNDTLTGLYVSIAQHTVGAWVQTGLTTWKERLPAEKREHEAILEAMRHLDEDRFRSAMKDHLTRSLADALEDLSHRDPDMEGRSS